MSLVPQHVATRDLSGILPADYTPVEVPYGRTPTKLRKVVAQGGHTSAASLRLAAAETGINLRTNVLDSMSMLETMTQDSIVRMKAVHSRANAANKSSFEELVQFDEKFIYSTRVGFGLERLVKEAGTELNVDWFDTFGLPIITPTSDLWTPTLAQLLSSLVPRVDHDAFKGQLRSHVTRPLFPFGDADIPDILLSMNMFSLTDVLGSTRRSLDTSQGEVDELDELIKQKLDAFAECKRKEDFEGAAARSDEALVLQGKRFDAQTARIKQLASGDTQSGGLVARLDSILKAPGLVELEIEKKKLKATAQSDIKLLEADRTKKYAKNESAIANYNNKVSESRRQVRLNSKKQDEAWTELEACLARIDSLGEESRVMVNDHMTMTEVEQKRRKEFAEFRESYAIQHQRLDELVVNCDAGTLFMEDVKRFLSSGRKIITDLKAEEQLKAMLTVEKAAFSKSFYAFAKHSAQIMERLSTRVLGSEKVVRGIKFQMQQAATVDDTDLPSYSRQVVTAESAAKLLKRRHEKHMVEFERREKQFSVLWDQVEDDDDDEAGEDSSDADALPEDDPDRLMSATQSPIVRARALIVRIRERYVAQIESQAEDDKLVVIKEKGMVAEIESSVQQEKARRAASPKKKSAAAAQEAE